MPRLIDADALIADLEYDVELDARALDCLDDESRRDIIQFDKDCKQNAIDLLRKAPTVQPELDCTLKEFGDCSYSETGCSDCKIKNKIRTALNITLCKDCKYWVVEEDEAYCYRIIMVHGAKDGSGFCSDAKRKMDNE